jgi:AraC family transcriptional regulator of adaptative response/methylated-DNA-[protein]-cysteine methyltransferase
MEHTARAPTNAAQTDAARLAAVRGRNAAADGTFYYAVATTGVYCNPSCTARPARAENLSFYPTRAHAEAAGFRACKRCRPDLPPRADREAALVAAACRSIEAAENELALATLAAEAALSPHHFHRLFRRIAGVTPKAYAAAQLQFRVQSQLASGAPVTRAIYDAGFNSTGRFYENADSMLGMSPSRYRAGAPGETIRFAIGDTSLGKLLVAATDIGLCAILLGDDEGRLCADLHARFPKADITAAPPDFAKTIARVETLIDSPKTTAPALPLDIRGTAFQRRVWEVLRSIPTGTTRSYSDVATQLGLPSAVRAVAGACAANALAVAIPCHRVVGKTGDLAGYRWGIARKRALLDREKT